MSLAVFLICASFLAAGWGLLAWRRGAARHRPFLVLAAALMALGAGVALSGTSERHEEEGSPGLARVCLTDPAIDLAGKSTTLPATTVLDDAGVLQGSRSDPSAWTETPTLQKAAIFTLGAVTLTQSARCAEVSVKMLIKPFAESTRQGASENHVFVIADVLDYPIPEQKAAIEFGKLVDDNAIKAVLLSDVTASTTASPAPSDDPAASERCLAGAQKLAALLGAGVGRQTTEVVFLAGVAAQEASYGCPIPGRSAPDLFFAWEGQIRPPAATMSLIARGGAFVTGAAPAEVMSEFAACLADALRPGADEAAIREFRGVRLECTVDGRTGHGGTATIYRRFGTVPAQPDASADAQASMERASTAAELEDKRKAAAALDSARWWQDPSVPEGVKSFAVRTARKIALGERCPAAAPSAAAMREEAAAAGIAPADVQPGGRYHDLLVGMIDTMRTETAKESDDDNCQAAKTYQ